MSSDCFIRTRTQSRHHNEAKAAALDTNRARMYILSVAHQTHIIPSTNTKHPQTPNYEYPYIKQPKCWGHVYY